MAGSGSGAVQCWCGSVLVWKTECFCEYSAGVVLCGAGVALCWRGSVLVWKTECLCECSAGVWLLESSALCMKTECMQECMCCAVLVWAPKGRMSVTRAHTYTHTHAHAHARTHGHTHTCTACGLRTVFCGTRKQSIGPGRGVFGEALASLPAQKTFLNAAHSLLACHFFLHFFSAA
eukprot:1140388-Pelagomonas_calceolata.AAC.2